MGAKVQQETLKTKIVSIVLIIFYSISYIRSIGEDEQRKKDPINSENHEKYLEKNLFPLNKANKQP